MTLQQRPLSEELPAASPTPPQRGRWHWQRIARGIWIVLALVMMANFVASIPAYYRIMRIVCTLPNQVPCTMPGQTTTSGQLTPDNVQALAQLHLSVATYAAYYVTLQVVLSLLFWGVGLLIFWRKSNEGIGLFVSLLLVLYGATGATDNFLGAWASTQSPLLLQILLYLIQVVQWPLLFAFLLTFPTGRFVPRWSWLLILLSFIPDVPTSVSPDWLLVLDAAALLLMFGSTLGIMVYRYVRVFDAMQRQQTKWFIYALGVGISLFGIGAALSTVVPADSPYQLLSATIPLLALTFIPFGLVIAILRYRLWDIDALINRTLVYGTLTALLVGLYVGLILALQALVRAVTGSISQQPLVLVGSTLVIAALFQPLRHRLQQIIDRRFYRRKYDTRRIIANFSATLRGEVELTELSERLVAVVEETMQPAHVSLWLRKPDQSQTIPYKEK